MRAPRLSLTLPAVLLLLASVAACTDSDEGVKQIQVENRADIGLRVALGASDFGLIAPAHLAPAQVIDNGPVPLLIDGATVDTLEFGSDNVSGLWTVVVDRFESSPGVFQLTWGFGAEN